MNKKLFKIIVIFFVAITILGFSLLIIPPKKNTISKKQNPSNKNSYFVKNISNNNTNNNYQERLKNLNTLEFKKENKVAYSFKTLDNEIVEVGTESHSPPQPYLKLNKWQGEGHLRVDIPYQTTEKPKQVGNKLRYKSIDGKTEIDFYVKEPEEITEIGSDGKERTFTINSNGGVEFDTILHEKPKTNKLEFPIQTENLNFYYQPPLHPEHPTWADDNNDGKPDSYRPQHVVGSYAVYHKDKSGDYSKMGGKNYKTGKAFHIYRPKIWDAEGNEVWGELKMDEEKGVLSVIVPQEFLDKAVYPVTVDPNFGYEGEGASTTIITSGSYISSGTMWIYGIRALLSENVEITQLSAYTSADSGITDIDLKLAVYTENGNGTDSHSLEGSSQITGSGTDPSWENASMDLSLGADVYVLSIMADSSDIQDYLYYYLHHDDISQTYYSSGMLTTFSLLDPWENDDLYSGTDRSLSIYATYSSCSSNGETCSVNDDCCSGNCVDSYCCDTACDGNCEACDISGSEGTCSYISSGTDPDGDCDGCANDCEAETTCDGNGNCQTSSCSAQEACQNGSCSGSNYCFNGGKAYCSCQGDNCFEDGGFDYICQAQCDATGTCDYAANCTSAENEKNRLQFSGDINMENFDISQEIPEPCPGTDLDDCTYDECFAMDGECCNDCVGDSCDLHFIYAACTECDCWCEANEVAVYCSGGAATP